MRWLLAALVLVACSCANAHDSKRPELDGWFDSLHTTIGGHKCCSEHDAEVLDDDDWDTKDNHYRVRVDGHWYDVPEDAVVKEPNLVGQALVWIGSTTGYSIWIRCFMPGTMT